MTVLLLCFLIGCVCGLRSLTAPAVVCWGAHLQRFSLAGTKLAWVGHPVTVGIFTALALVELVTDKLPSTPARTKGPGLIARVVMGAFSGLVLGVAGGANAIVAAIIGIVGALVGTFGGYQVRHTLVTKAHIPDFAVALFEDAVAIVGGWLIVSHL